MSKNRKVEVQKGPIESNPLTSKQMTHSQKQFERREELNKLKWGMTLDYEEPKK